MCNSMDKLKKRAIGIIHLIEKKLLNFAKVKMFMKLFLVLVLLVS